MATAPTLPLMSVEEYLNSSWRPDKEYVDGVLVERSLPTIVHGILQMLLIRLFAVHEDKLGFISLPEVRTQIVEGARYRIPDVMLCPIPVPRGRIVDVVPWVVIEILSPDDKVRDQLERFRDYAHIGVRAIILLDPERLLAYRYEADSLIHCKFDRLTLPTGDLPFDTEALFRQLVAKESAGHDEKTA